MTDEIDLSGEQDPTERMVEQQQNAQERAERDDNEREAEHEGEISTDDFDIADAVEGL